MKIYFESLLSLNSFSEILLSLNAVRGSHGVDEEGLYERYKLRETVSELRIIQPSHSRDMNLYLEKVKGFCDLLMDLNG